MPDSNIIRSIIRGAEILKSVDDGIDRIKYISEKHYLSKSTTHRLLKTLARAGFVMQDPITRRYYLGPLILSLASSPIAAHQSLIVCASEDMKYLRNVSGETVVLHIRIGVQRICLEELQSVQNIRFTAGKGYIAPLYTGSAGKVLLAELKEDELNLLLKNIDLVAVGPNTITDEKFLRKEVKKVRKHGYAISFGERIEGSASISVPVRNYICPVALSVLGPDNRFKPRMMDMLQGMKETAQNISKRLMEGFQGREVS